MSEDSDISDLSEARTLFVPPHLCRLVAIDMGVGMIPRVDEPLNLLSSRNNTEVSIEIGGGSTPCAVSIYMVAAQSQTKTKNI